jgi:hypothetical protein
MGLKRVACRWGDWPVAEGLERATLLDELQRKRPGLVDGGEIALAGRNDRATEENLELVREGPRFTQARLLGESLQELVDPFEGRHGRGSYRRGALVDLQHRVYEQATPEAAVPKPLVEDLNESSGTFIRCLRPPGGLGLEQPVRPERLVSLEDRDDEVVLRPEVPVERSLRHACVSDDAVDTDRGEAFSCEELVSRADDSLACVETRFLGGITPREAGAGRAYLGGAGDRFIVLTGSSSCATVDTESLQTCLSHTDTYEELDGLATTGTRPRHRDTTPIDGACTGIGLFRAAAE